jgi:hypothetical protein
MLECFPIGKAKAAARGTEKQADNAAGEKPKLNHGGR